MCGINLVVSSATIDLKPPLSNMLAKTSARGPDSQGEFYHTFHTTRLALGANRLRIVDREANADQPMRSACGKYILAYNGEVYNYHDLKSELLRQGQEFRTASDTEVVLYWLKRNGAEGLKSFKGMFALVFIDLVHETILVARDRHGIKPLFYCQNHGNFIVSSSLQAIVSTPLVEQRLAYEAVHEYLSFRHVLGDKTFYQDIYSVQPGTCLEYSGATLLTKPYGNGQQNEEKADLRETLVDAVTLVTSATEQAGLLLSGGVDSTLLLAMLHRELGYHSFPTFTLNTGEDAAWAAKAAKKYEARHHQIDLERADFQRALTFLDQLDQPVADHGALATWLVAEKAGLNHRVLISGAGADELFAGYNRHRAFHRYLKAPQAWRLYQKFAAFLGYWGHPKAVKAFLKGLSEDKSETFKNFLIIHGIEQNYHSVNSSNPAKLPVASITEALAFDKANYLVNDVLAITDLATMAQGIETRVPYLYDDVVQTAAGIPVEDKIRQRGKAPLKEMLIAYEGKVFAQRKKVGFGLPMAEFMRQKDFLLWSLLQPGAPVFEFVNEAAVTKMKSEHQAGKNDWNMQLWTILVLSHWLKENFN